MGSDRYTENRMVAENNFWPARALLERVAIHLRYRNKYFGGIVESERQLLTDIEEMLERTKTT